MSNDQAQRHVCSDLLDRMLSSAEKLAQGKHVAPFKAEINTIPTASFPLRPACCELIEPPSDLGNSGKGNSIVVLTPQIYGLHMSAPLSHVLDSKAGIRNRRILVAAATDSRALDNTQFG